MLKVQDNAKLQTSNSCIKNQAKKVGYQVWMESLSYKRILQEYSKPKWFLPEFLTQMQARFIWSPPLSLKVISSLCSNSSVQCWQMLWLS